MATLSRSNDNSLPEQHQVTRDGQGDLTLVVGAKIGDKIPKRFVVWARNLRYASPVWSAMLDPSNGFSESTKKAVELPDDDPEALLIVLRIAHINFSAIPDVLTATQAFNLAILCDKYDAIGLVKPFYGSKSLVDDKQPKRSNPVSYIGAQIKWSYTIGDTCQLNDVLYRLAFDVSIGSKGDLLYGNSVLEELPIDLPKEHILGLRSDCLHAAISDISHVFKLLSDKTHCGETSRPVKEQDSCTAATLRGLVKGLAAVDLKIWPLHENLPKTPKSVSDLQTMIARIRVVDGHYSCTVKANKCLGSGFYETCVAAMKNRSLPAHIENYLKEQAAK